jgi:hypothetical protein
LEGGCVVRIKIYIKFGKASIFNCDINCILLQFRHLFDIVIVVNESEILLG